MASVPPPTGRSSRRSFQFKKEATLPDLPRFEAIASDSDHGTQPTQEDIGSPRPEATLETPPKEEEGKVTAEAPAEGEEAKATAETPPKAKEAEISKSRSARSDRRPYKDRNDQTAKPRPQPMRDTVPTAAVEEAHTAILIRLRFEEGVKEKAQKCCEATGATLADLAKLAKRNMELTDDDFSASPLWPGTIYTAPKGETHRTRLKVRTDMLTRWSKKLDPLGLRQPGEVAFSAAQNAFNRAALSIIAELMKAR